VRFSAESCWILLRGISKAFHVAEAPRPNDSTVS
jgi:hypothetical protein